MSTCWLPLVYTIRRYINHKDVISIVGYKDTETTESQSTLISLTNLGVINDLKNDYTRMRVTFNMNNETFVYCALSQEFGWPVEESFEHSWIQKAYLTNKTLSPIDVTDIINMYAGPERNFYNSMFDFNWIPEIANSSATQLDIYDHNNFCYKVNLTTNTEINDDNSQSIALVCGIKLFCRSSDGFETM